ncbi:hypothetical protein RPD_2133 [Rhodopseudomonas palustris BisB5]|uniref:Uncharacterized protein n=1 Tax=Rhodopseudomonas palustris (strain BisB5) TaxID=316057 RepID=Q138X1_RHOPS|nr:hypothetical protein RPD_2133 [Rhodopseudomonas palustris BisB5]
MRKLTVAIAVVATFGTTASTFISRAQAQHAVVRPAPSHGDWQRGHRANRPWIVNRGHGINRFDMGRRHGRVMGPRPGMHGRRH